MVHIDPGRVGRHEEGPFALLGQTQGNSIHLLSVKHIESIRVECSSCVLPFVKPPVCDSFRDFFTFYRQTFDRDLT